jgi:hypothetical protein
VDNRLKLLLAPYILRKSQGVLRTLNANEQVNLILIYHTDGHKRITKIFGPIAKQIWQLDQRPPNSSLFLSRKVADSKMAQKSASVFPNLQQNLTPTSYGTTIHSYSHGTLGDGPIAVLIHGYPQSAYM